MPESVVMRVKDTEVPKVGTESHYKHAMMEGPARIDSGLLVLVPQFIAAGDWIRRLGLMETNRSARPGSFCYLQEAPYGSGPPP